MLAFSDFFSEKSVPAVVCRYLPGPKQKTCPQRRCRKSTYAVSRAKSPYSDVTGCLILPSIERYRHVATAQKSFPGLLVRLLCHCAKNDEGRCESQARARSVAGGRPGSRSCWR